MSQHSICGHFRWGVYVAQSAVSMVHACWDVGCVRRQARQFVAHCHLLQYQPVHFRHALVAVPSSWSLCPGTLLTGQVAQHSSDELVWTHNSGKSPHIYCQSARCCPRRA